MRGLNNNDWVFPDYIKFINNNNSTIIINGLSGVWATINNDVLAKIKHCIKNNLVPIEYIKTFESEECKKELVEVFEVLIDENMLSDSDTKEFKTDIKNIEFKITNKCNLNCLHCAASSKISNCDILSTKDILCILDKLFQLNIEDLLLTGGEPLIRKDIKEILYYIKNNFNGTVKLITNGTLIDKEMAHTLKECVQSISISMDGYDKPSTDFIRGQGVYEKILKAIDNLKEAGFEKDTILISMTCTNQNFNHRDDFKKLCEKLNVTSFVRQFSALGRGLENYKDLGLKNYLLLNQNSINDIEEIKESLDCKIFCKAGLIKLMIDDSGDVYPCLILDNKKYNLGNILENEISSILNSDKYNNFINHQLKTNVVDTLSSCKNCNVRYFCMDSCLGVTNSYFDNAEIREERCKQIKPYLSNILWS